MRIQVKGRNDATVEAELRARVEKKLAKVARQVSPLADLEVELREESNPSIKDSQIAEATLHLKGVTLRATERSTDMTHSINLVAEDLARQVKKHRDKRRARRDRGASRRGARAPPEPSANRSRALPSPCYRLCDDHSRSRAAGRRGEEVQDLREGRRAHQRLRARARARVRRRAAGPLRGAPRAPPERRVARRPPPGDASRSPARRASARSASATSTSS